MFGIKIKNEWVNWDNGTRIETHSFQAAIYIAATIYGNWNIEPIK